MWNEVGIVVNSSLRDELIGVIRKEDKIITFKIVIAKETSNVISIYMHLK